MFSALGLLSFVVCSPVVVVVALCVPVAADAVEVFCDDDAVDEVGLLPAL